MLCNTCNHSVERDMVTYYGIPIASWDEDRNHYRRGMDVSRLKNCTSFSAVVKSKFSFLVKLSLFYCQGPFSHPETIAGQALPTHQKYNYKSQNCGLFHSLQPIVEPTRAAIQRSLHDFIIALQILPNGYKHQSGCRRTHEVITELQAHTSVQV